MLLVYESILPSADLLLLQLGVQTEVQGRVVGVRCASLDVPDLVACHVFLAVFLVFTSLHVRTFPYFLVEPLFETSDYCQVLPLLLSLKQHCNVVVMHPFAFFKLMRSCAQHFHYLHWVQRRMLALLGLLEGDYQCCFVCFRLEREVLLWWLLH